MLARLVVRGIVAAAVFFVGATARAADAWHVPEAALRYRVELSRSPTHGSAGYFVHLPDGGILKRVAPSVVAVTPEGRQLDATLLWQNSESGFSVVFADPGRSVKTVDVYVRTDLRGQFWKPDSGLTPSAVLCANPGQDGIGKARDLAKFGRVEASVHTRNKAGIPVAPLSIGGDDTGRPRPGVFYLLSYVDAPETGRYWVAPFTQEGETEVFIDGVKLVASKRTPKWGGEGAWFDLKQGLHRLEVFQSAPGKGPYTGARSGQSGLMYLTWRTPGDKMQKEETRVLKDSEIVRSGACVVSGVESQDGAPVACASVEARHSYWFENEEPLVLYHCRALPGGNPPDTVYTWTFPEKASVEAKDAPWIFPGFRESKIKLSAKSARGVSECSVSLFGFGTRAGDLNRAADRAAYRDALAGMLKAQPRGANATAEWSDAHWNNIFRTLEEGEGYALLSQLFGSHWEGVKNKLGASQINALQDALLAVARRDKPPEALKWMEFFERTTPDPARRSELKLQEAELQMFELADVSGAGKTLALLAGLTDDAGERARIRMGDLALLAGDLNKATSAYSEVQSRARARRNASKSSVGTLVSKQLVDAGAPGAAAKPSSPAQTGAPRDSARERSGALLDVSFSENVKTLVEGGYLLEARQALRAWEAEFPLSKVSGDFILRESEFYMKARNWKRARPLLEAYCREIDASSFLPDAASLLIDCVRQSNEPKDSIREVIEKVKVRLRFHPVAKEMDAFLSGK